jgi:uncharacterized repeat protein (TIGR03803 family)
VKCCILKAIFFLLPLALELECAPRAEAQGWVTNSPLIVPRWAHTATLLNDGTVLIAGGIIHNVSGNFEDTNECEIYDPVAGSPSATASMNDNRHSHQATLLPNGQVLLSGGGGDSTSETFDPGSGSWINFVSMKEERIVHIAVLLTNGQVLAAGGFDDNQGIDTATSELYDPSTQTWTTNTPMPYAADTLAAVPLSNGTVLVCGGSFNSGGVTNAAIYYPASQTWSNVPPMNKARAGHAATLLNDGRVLVEGGSLDNSAEIFDPVSQTWTLAASMNDGRLQTIAARLVNGEVMVTGDGNPDVELYDPVNHVWTYTNSLPVPGNLQTETLLADGRVLVTGGSVSQFNGPPESVIETFTFGASGPPPASIVVTNSPLSGLVPLAVQFTSPATDSAGNPVTNWNWNFGDGGFSTNRSPLHTYTVVGSYSPSLTVTDSVTGNSVSVSGLQSVNVTNATVTVTVTPLAGAVPLTVQFTSPGVDSLGNTITNWSWSFGDGTNSTAQSPTHIYTTVGGFSPSLVAISTHSSTPLTVNGLSVITVSNSPNPFFHVLYSMPTNSSPNGGLTLANGVLYGTTISGGAVFAIGTNGSGFTNLFVGLGRPNGDLALSGATLYGSSYLGGTNGGGAVFAVNTNGGGFTNLYSFPLGGPSIGQDPAAGVIFASNVLYGTTQFGGAHGSGAVFAISTNGVGISDQYSFSPALGDFRINTDGDGPLAKVIFANGVLYGTTEAGGTSGDGVVFSVGTNNPGSFVPLHSFSSSSNSSGTNYDGAFPFAGLLLVGNTLYGTTAFGGLYGNGSIFAINTNGTFTNLYSFTGGMDGASPEGEVIISGGTLYGTTTTGGTSGDGVIYSVNTDGTGFRTLYNFTGGNDGATPKGALTLAGNFLYGATTTGGAGMNAGAIFSFTLPSPVALSITRSGTNVIVTWSTNVIGFTLQSSAQLGAGASWNTVSPSPVVVNGLDTVTNGIAGPRNFYRLSQ